MKPPKLYCAGGFKLERFFLHRLCLDFWVFLWYNGYYA